ncbi:predicted protein [Botrytis cinerea T4]|uniref:Uncharacterized protein n=1 Tax=Botryotinia fuckeliana (strain T4) TaxID=999810 RepID=G2YGB8_BOTF4|nr:predicted protein [Botrytis cinerea T4]
MNRILGYIASLGGFRLFRRKIGLNSSGAFAMLYSTRHKPRNSTWRLSLEFLVSTITRNTPMQSTNQKEEYMEYVLFYVSHTALGDKQGSRLPG